MATTDKKAVPKTTAKAATKKVVVKKEVAKPTVVKAIPKQKVATKIAVANHKGGVLKTTLTVNLAAIMSQKGKVLIIDTDPQASVASTWGLSAEQHFSGKTLTNVLSGEIEVSGAINSVDLKIDILSADMDLAHASYTPQQVVSVIRELETKYDYIFFDTNPGLNIASKVALALADKILIPSAMETYSIQGVIKLVKALHEENIKPYAVVPTLFDGRSVLHQDGQQGLTDLLKPYGIKVTKQTISKSTEVSKIIQTHRSPLFIVKPKSKTSKEFLALVEELKL